MPRQKNFACNLKRDFKSQAPTRAEYTQAGELYRILTPEQQERLIQNIVGSLGQARQDIQKRQLAHFLRADVDYGRRVAEGLSISID